MCKNNLSPQAEICGKCRHPIGPIRRAKARFRFEKFLWFWLTVLMTAAILFLLYRMYAVPQIADPLAHVAGKLRELASYAVAIAILVACGTSASCEIPAFQTFNIMLAFGIEYPNPCVVDSMLCR